MLELFTTGDKTWAGRVSEALEAGTRVEPERRGKCEDRSLFTVCSIDGATIAVLGGGICWGFIVLALSFISLGSMSQ